jgi:Domain of unknown function (DUF4270)
MNLAVVKTFFSLSILSTILFSCNKSTSIGSELQPQNLGVVFTDDITIETSTILIDPINTTNREVLLVGQYTDPHLGQVKANSFFAVQPFNKIFSFGANPQFKEAIFSFPVSFAYGDTTQNQTVSLHRLNSSIDPNKIYSNKDVLPYDPTPIASYTFKGSEATVYGKLNIPLPNSFRDEIITLVNNNALDSLEQSELDNFIKGFALVSQNGEAIWGLRVTDQIPAAIEIRYLDETQTEKAYRISVRNAVTANDINNQRYNSFRFNSVTCNRSATPLVSLNQAYQTIPAAQTQNLTFIQESLGIRTKITFPDLGKLVANQTIAVNRADLIISPVENTVSSFLKRPRSLNLQTLNSEGKLKEYYLFLPDPNFGLTIQDTIPQTIQVEGANPLGFNNSLNVSFSSLSNSYNFEITSYIQYYLNQLNPRYQGVNKLSNDGLILASNLSNSGISRLVLGGYKHPKQPIRLRVFYTIVK